MNPRERETCQRNSTRLIPLTRGYFATVDAKDYEYLSQFKWYAHTPSPRKMYAVRTLYVNGRSKHFYMRRELLGLTRGDKREADHKDGNGLNNTRQNLRIATHSQNLWNRSKTATNRSGFKGVSYKPGKNRKNRWTARITVDGIRIRLGDFFTKAEAYEAYCYAAKRLHGKFAYLKK